MIGSGETVGSHGVPARDTDGELITRLRRECYELILPGVDVPADADFFELGGDSIMLIRLVAIAQRVFGVTIDALDFFQRPTLTALATAVRERLVVPAAADDLEAILAQVETM